MSKDNIASSAHTRASLYLVLVFAALALWPTVAVLGECLERIYRSAICNKAPAADGKIYITVTMDGGLPREHALIQRALDAWNVHSETTGVVFEAAPPGTAPDLTISYTEDESAGGTSGCAKTFPGAGKVYWGLTLRNRNLFLGDDEFAAVMMHEIGHFLGLNDTTSDTIMKQGESCASPAGATNVTSSDAQEVAGCFASFCAPLHARPTPTPSGSGPCLDHYRFVAVYNSEGDIMGYQSEWAGCY